MLNEQGSTLPPAVVTIDFHGQQLESWRDERTEKVYVAMRRLCDNMGLAWSPQRTKIAQSHLFKGSIGVMEIVTPGGVQQVLGLDLDLLPAWLLGIHPDKVAPDIRVDLTRYQQECVRALRDYWFTGAATRTEPPTVRDPRLQLLIDMALHIDEHGQRLDAVETKAAQAIMALGSMPLSSYLFLNGLSAKMTRAMRQEYRAWLTTYCLEHNHPIDKNPVVGKAWQTENRFPTTIIHLTLRPWMTRYHSQLSLPRSPRKRGT